MDIFSIFYIILLIAMALLDIAIMVVSFIALHLWKVAKADRRALKTLGVFSFLFFYNFLLGYAFTKIL